MGMTLDPAAAGRPPAVTLTMRAVPGATKAVRWRLTRDARPVAAGELRPNQSRDVRLRGAGVPGRHALPACELGASLVWSSRREPAPAVWRAGDAPRPLTLYLGTSSLDINRR